jgi:hypothetical protein
MLPPDGQADTAGIEITPAMIEAGLGAYASLAWHDSLSPASPNEIVEAILLRGIEAGRCLGPRR